MISDTQSILDGKPLPIAVSSAKSLNHDCGHRYGEKTCMNDIDQGLVINLLWDEGKSKI